MTTFYRFPDRAAFIAAGGMNYPEYYHESIGYSVIGEQYESTEEFGEDAPLILREFLVNTTAPVEGWESFEVKPSQPMRIFG